jgi:hypothetical protein
LATSKAIETKTKTAEAMVFIKPIIAGVLENFKETRCPSILPNGVRKTTAAISQ